MSTTVTVDSSLISEAMRLTGIKTAGDMIQEALTRLVRIERQKDVLKLEGKVSRTEEPDEARESRFIEGDDFNMFVDSLNNDKKVS